VRWKRAVLATAAVLVILAGLGSFLFQGRPVLAFQPGRDAATLHAAASSTTGELKLMIHGAGRYVVTSLKIKVNEYFVYAPLPTTFPLYTSESLPVTFTLPANWTISVNGPYSSGQTITVELEGTWWASGVIPVPITLTAITKILWT